YLILLFLWSHRAVRGNAGCTLFNWCNGHGTCNTATTTCTCDEGWGADTDITLYRAADCSARVCPSGKSWGDVPSGPMTAHQEQECSNRGLCDRETGQCSCFDGFSGAACERSQCPNDCSDHGRCVNMKALATTPDALPLSNVTTYTGEEQSTYFFLHIRITASREDDTVTWDEDMIYGCVCDSSWEVGLGAGQTQEPEWFGPDCSLRHCPSGDDPTTTEEDETDCSNATSSSVYGGNLGGEGNRCQVDCSNRGACDYETGLCDCFTGYYGHNCGLQSALAK
ncbi:unnamed protein product, partial [Ascophyllum nodosum]